MSGAAEKEKDDCRSVWPLYAESANQLPRSSGF